MRIATDVGGGWMRMELTAIPEAAAAARSNLSGLGLTGRALSEVPIILSELVTNAVVHSGATADDVIHVLIKRTDGPLRIEVSDPGRGETRPHIRADHLDYPGGWGLRIVRDLSVDWGVREGRGVCVWCDYPVREAS